MIPKRFEPMWKNFLLVAIRNISRNKSFTFINVAGLTIGIASAIFILLFIISELSYDRMYINADRIYRLYQEGKMSNSEFRGAWTCPPLGPVLMDELPEVTDYTRIVRGGQILLKIEGKKYLKEHMIFADSGFFNFFDLPVLHGNPALMLRERNSLVLTESIATKYFGKENPVGKIIETDTDTSVFTITGVVADPPDETHLRFNLIISFSGNPESKSKYWLSSYLYTYILLDKRESAKKVENKLREVTENYIGPQVQQVMGIDIKEYEASGDRYEYFLQPLTDIHLDPSIPGGFKPPSDKKYLFIFGFIAIFIILIGSINFMNLSTAKASQRAKEVGMRKITGSGRGLIIKQFLWESIFLSLLSLIFAMIIVEIVLPFFNSMMDLNLKIQYLSTWYTIPGLILLAVMVGFLCGSYPAFILSSYKPVEALKGRFASAKGGSLTRNILVIVQFTISIVIITGTIIIFSQLRYIRKKDMGFTRDNVLVIYRLDPLGDSISSFMQELEKFPSILKTTNSTVYAGNSNYKNSYQIKGRDKNTSYFMSTYWTDPYFIDAYNINLVAGRFFNDSIPDDTAAIVINETAIREFEIRDTFNTIFILPMDEGMGKELKVIGVVKDFHSASLHENISPLAIQLKTSSQHSGFISLSFDNGKDNFQHTLQHIQRTWSQFTDNEPLQYFFLNDRLNQFYLEEQRSGKLSLVFSLLAIFLAGLGLYGLTMYTTQRRLKEISIRKVHGATDMRIVLMILTNISVLLVISTIIAWLISWITAGSWLKGFSYRIELHPSLFISGAFLAFIIAVIIVGLQAYTAAQAQPARSLRYE